MALEAPPPAEPTVWGPQAPTTTAAVTFNECYQLVQSTSFGSTIACLNVFHFGTESVGNSANSLVVDWRDNIVPTWKTAVSADIAFKEVYAQQFMPSESAVASVTLSGTGVSGAFPAPAVCAGVITWRTQFLGRRHRGRSYVAGLPYAYGGTSDGMKWMGNGVTFLGNIANAILTRYTLGGNPYGFQLMVWSKITYDQLVNTADWRQAATMVTRYTVQPYIATMGSRRFGRGM